MCLTKIFIAIFAPDERLSSSATLEAKNVKYSSLKKMNQVLLVGRMLWAITTQYVRLVGEFV